MSKIALNYYNLKKGDIILTSIDDDISRKIQTLTNSKYTHASLCLTSTSVIEATLQGVNLFSPLYFVFNSIDDLKVLRLKYDNYQNIDQILLGIEDAARDFSFRKYSTFGAIKAGKAKQIDSLTDKPHEKIQLLDKWEKAVHCSQLVSLAYNIGGKITLSDSLPPELITPSDIESSIILEDVTALVTLEIGDDKIGNSKIYPNVPDNSVPSEQTIVAQTALSKLEPVFKEINYPIPPDLNYVFPLLGELEEEKAMLLDDRLDNILSLTGFYNLGEKFEQLYLQGNDILTITSRQIENGEINKSNKDAYLFEIDFQINTNRGTIKRQTENLYTCIENYAYSQKKTFLSLIDMYKKVISFCYSCVRDGLEAKKMIDEKIK
ncbi:MAG: hypothetical protein A2X13_11305 [Bacteroidetes bacterium GWC2_33_15]|nr:MAG: hypothetical protein A2X10_12700 [Bacteroidetes bacterium GWA2_33_15]OFX52374.1 MAG: hypothetical protein A2X13_11305 [Bacteroidetes bacterium GWC2_33_15]OFX64523.1 MAG: hypothetical protein A2X15_14160 [Bacteroidetes bacterium GWB2_32_14]OFX68941.1 MAG: hypothetical protein A2X14_08635 [Bacteroidetes bacterium GWD2_33_33]